VTDQQPRFGERLQKVLAHAGLASRRACEDLIRQGRVWVNGRVVRELGTRVDPNRDEIRVDGQKISQADKKVYIILNKPSGYLSGPDATANHPTALDLVRVRERLYAVGRLDLRSEGLLLLTNDGELAYWLTHPRFGHEKEYLVWVEGVPDDATLARWRKGVELDGRLTAPARVTIKRIESGGAWLQVVLREGRKRQIRRVAASLGHPVRRLIRIRLGNLRLDGLAPGQWRYLTRAEVAALRNNLR